MINRFVDDLETRLKKMISETAAKLVNGQCGDYDDYQYHVGYARGLGHAHEEARKLLKQSISNDEADDEPLPMRRVKL